MWNTPSCGSCGIKIHCELQRYGWEFQVRPDSTFHRSGEWGWKMSATLLENIIGGPWAESGWDSWPIGKHWQSLCICLLCLSIFSKGITTLYRCNQWHYIKCKRYIYCYIYIYCSLYRPMHSTHARWCILNSCQWLCFHVFHQSPYPLPRTSRKFRCLSWGTISATVTMKTSQRTWCVQVSRLEGRTHVRWFPLIIYSSSIIVHSTYTTNF